ncbi:MULTISPECIES: hypothetical protein [Parachlamydia]|uniref:hypothetical protein n=1 Tax=Parachlamydia TaxID=83551 RepID=UPI0001C17BA2|nr:hypothetical protein [Parachlamydia acanthamoebae]EFB42145.1 hypothetical protein pah_c014o057 [Parachlamydia acanthamoebae str. Hall's coccus]
MSFYTYQSFKVPDFRSFEIPGFRHSSEKRSFFDSDLTKTWENIEKIRLFSFASPPESPSFKFEAKTFRSTHFNLNELFEESTSHLLGTIVKVISLSFAVLITGGLMAIPLGMVIYAQKKQEFAEANQSFNMEIFVKDMTPSKFFDCLVKF